MRLVLFLILSACLVLAPQARAEEDGAPADLEGLSGEKALELVKELAADEMKGRKTAYEGGSLVENWLLEKFSEFGLHPADAGGTYLEPFTYGATNTVAPIACTLGDRTLSFGTDYYDLSYTGSGTVKAPVVFCGYGISRPDLGWDDYEGVDVKGKIVLAIRGAPAAQASQFPVERAIGYKSSTAAAKGAVGFLLVEGEKPSNGTIQERYYRPQLPALWISAAVCEGILAEKPGWLAETKAALDAGTRGRSKVAGTPVSMQVNAPHAPHAKGHNALGEIKGRDPDLNHEIILVGAHMDHLGVDPLGNVYNGADDNASGTAVLVHLADVLTGNRFRPKRSVIFCAFGAEEQGLMGSKALAARYPFQGEIVAVLNMDMVGQGEPVVNISGVGAYPEMHQRLQGYLPKDIQAHTTWGLRTGPHGDHWPFHERGIPSFFIGTKGPHPNYHTTADDVANIQPACLEAAARTVGALLIGLATDPKPLAQPNGIADYLVREGPVFSWMTSTATDAADASASPAWLRQACSDGASCVLLEVRDPAQDWAQLEQLETREGAERIRLVRRAADVDRAFQEGRVGVLPYLACGHLLKGTGSDPAALLSTWHEQGYRVVAPFVGLSNAPVTGAQAKPILEAAAKLPLLLDLRGLDLNAWPEARRILGARPALFLIGAEAPLSATEHQSLGDLGPDTLRLRAAVQGDWATPALAAPLHPAVQLSGSDPRLLLPALAGWGTAQPAGWDLPDSPQRAALRGLLGGRLVEWLARSER
jgi:aminopeptidase YwaD